MENRVNTMESSMKTIEQAIIKMTIIQEMQTKQLDEVVSKSETISVMLQDIVTSKMDRESLQALDFDHDRSKSLLACAYLNLF